MTKNQVHPVVDDGWPTMPSLADLGVDTVRQPAVGRRGILECYYGDPWTPAERRAMIASASRLGLDTYVYGPADDSRTGHGWRDGYDPDELAEFRDLCEFGATRGVGVTWRVSPGAPLQSSASIVVGDDRERSLLIERLRQMLDVGVREVLVAFDDLAAEMPPEDVERFGSDAHPVAASQAFLIAEIVGEIGPERLVVCPTLYWGRQDTAYCSRLTELVDPSVPFAWTGPAVVSGAISAADASAARAALGRPIWLWDNYPVNDWSHGMLNHHVPPDRLFLGPVDRRDPEVAATVDGYFVNLSSRPAATLAVTASAAAWAHHPEDYDGDDVMSRVVDHLDSSGSLATLVTLHGVSPLRPGFGPGPGSDLPRAVWELLALLDGGREGDLGECLDRVRTVVAATVQQVERLPHGAIADAVRPWVDELLDGLALASVCVDVLAAALAGNEDALAPARAALRMADESKVERSARQVAAGALDALLTRAYIVAGTSAPPPDFVS